jgi:hypothetical protein
MSHYAYALDGLLFHSVKDENQSSDMLFDPQRSLAAAGRPLMPQSLLMTQAPAPHLLAHAQALQEPPPFFASGLVGHPGFAPFHGMPPPPGLAVFPGFSAHQGLPGLQDYQSGILNQQRNVTVSQEMQQEIPKSDQMSVGSNTMTQMSDQQAFGWQDNQPQQHYSQLGYGACFLVYCLFFLLSINMKSMLLWLHNKFQKI